MDLPLSQEARRLDAVRRSGLLDTPRDGSFDRVTELAANVLGVPIALVTIVDEDRIWFKSRYGLDGITDIPRDPGLCASAILQDGPYVIEAARTDPRTLANPLVAGAHGLQFYAGVPLKTRDGSNLGMLCVLDYVPRTPTSEQIGALAMMAAIVTDEMELRMQIARLFSAEREVATEGRE